MELILLSEAGKSSGVGCDTSASGLAGGDNWVERSGSGGGEVVEDLALRT